MCGGGSPSMYSSQEGRKACAGLAYLWGSPWPSHLLGLYDVSQVSIREDPTVERGKVLLHPGPGRALAPPHCPVPPPPHSLQPLAGGKSSEGTWVASEFPVVVAVVSSPLGSSGAVSEDTLAKHGTRNTRSSKLLGLLIPLSP